MDDGCVLGSAGEEEGRALEFFQAEVWSWTQKRRHPPYRQARKASRERHLPWFSPQWKTCCLVIWLIISGGLINQKSHRLRGASWFNGGCLTKGYGPGFS